MNYAIYGYETSTFLPLVGTFHKLENCPIKLCWAFFRNCGHAKKNIWPHSTVFTEQEKWCARSKSELNYKNVQKMSPQCCKLPKGYKIQNITQTLELFEVAEENYWDDDAAESF